MIKIKHILLFALIFSGCWAGPAWAQEETIAATVNGSVISTAEVDYEMNQAMPRSFFHKTVSDERKEMIRRQALRNLIDNELKVQDAERLGLEVNKKDIDEELERVIAKYPSREAFDEKIKAGGFTIDEVRGAIKRRQLVGLVSRMEVQDKVQVRKSDTKRYYNKNKNKFVQPAQYHLSNILLRVPPLADKFERKAIKDRAKGIVQKIREGMPFEEAVQKYSEGPDKEKDGDMGFLHQGRLLPEVEKEVMSLKPGEVAGPFKTFKGYYIFRLNEVRAERLLPFEEVKEKLLSDLQAKALEEREKAWIAELKSKAHIVVNDPAFKDEPL